MSKGGMSATKRGNYYVKKGIDHVRKGNYNLKRR